MVLLPSAGEYRLQYPHKGKDITADKHRGVLSPTQGSSLPSFPDGLCLKYVNGLRYLLGLGSASDIQTA